MADVKELIPEFFYLPEFLVNSNNFDLGEQILFVGLFMEIETKKSSEIYYYSYSVVFDIVVDAQFFPKPIIIHSIFEGVVTNLLLISQSFSSVAGISRLQYNAPYKKNYCTRCHYLLTDNVISSFAITLSNNRNV